MADVSKLKIDHIQFGLLTCDEIRRCAVIQVVDDELHQKDKRPSDFGLFSRYLGATQIHRCLTCGHGPLKCTGHFGYIELGTWIYHPSHIDDVVDILNRVCCFCAELLEPHQFQENDDTTSPENKKQKVEQPPYTCCAHCKLPNPTSWVKDYGIRIQPKWHTKTKFPDDVTKKEAHTLFTAERALEILSSISDETYAALGYKSLQYTHPKSYIIDVIPVSSLASRSVVTRGRGASSGSRSQDDHTALYQSILKSALDLQKKRALLAQRAALGDNLAEVRRLKLDKKKIDKAKDQIQRIPDDIQVRVGMLYVKDIRAVVSKSRKLCVKHGSQPAGIPVHGPSRSTQPIASYSSINDRITGNNKKRALMRGNLMGKRVEFTARTVITPDPTLAVNEVGVPLSICKDQTFKEFVTDFNLDWCNSLVKTGPEKYPGSVAVWKIKRHRRMTTQQSVEQNENLENREKICLLNTTREFRSTIRLRIGDIVERHIYKGDIMLFNRQPSLHKNSIMAHFVVPSPNSTFSFNSTNCQSYNADHDGDEMNGHFIQTHDARADAIGLLLVDHNICSPQTGGTVVTIIQDMVTDVCLATMNTLIVKDLLVDMMCALDIPGEQKPFVIPEPAIRVKRGNEWKSCWTGAQLASQTFPTATNVTHHKTHILLTRNDSDDPILDGALTIIRHGEFCCGWLTKKVLNQVTENLFKDCGSNFIPGTTLSIAGAYLTRVSRLTYQYCLRVPSTFGMRDVMVEDPVLKKRIDDIVSKTTSILSKRADELSEAEISKLSQKIVKYVGDAIVKHQPKNISQMSNFFRPVINGARASVVDIVQIMACLGQQHVEGQRIPLYLQEGRSLPFFLQNTSKKNLIARGLVVFCSFLSGLDPAAFIMHMMSGREGIISTAIKTAQSGYIARKLITLMKGVIKHGHVIMGKWFLAFRYYGDGLDASTSTRRTVTQLYDQGVHLVKRYHRIMPPQHMLELIQAHDIIVKIKTKSILQNHIEPQVLLFYKFSRVLTRAYRAIQNEWSLHDLCAHGTPCDPWKRLQEIHGELAQMVTSGIALVQFFVDSIDLAEELLKLERMPLHSAYKKVLRFAEVWDWIRTQCLQQAFRALAANGEPLGNQGASAAGERTTQLTLDTHHAVGKANVIGAGGLQRLGEVMNVTPTKKMRAPTMRLSIHADSKHQPEQIAQMIETVYLKDIVDSAVLEPETLHSKEDHLVQRIFEARYIIRGEYSHFYKPVQRNGIAKSKRKALPIDSRVYRICLNKQKCIEHNVSIQK